MQITRIKSGRRSKTCYKRAIFTELQQIKNYAKLVAKGQLCWNMAAPLERNIILEFQETQITWKHN